MFIEEREGDARAQNHNSLTCPEESNYTGRTVERNEHHRYAAVLSQMAYSLIPCPKKIRNGTRKRQANAAVRRARHNDAGFPSQLDSPLPVKSSYQTLVGLSTWKQSYAPLGETLTCPSAWSGAVATKKRCCFSIHSSRLGGQVSKKTTMLRTLLQPVFDIV